MGNFRNLDGTTKNSFKIGSAGVLMTSTAAVDQTSKDNLTKYLVTNQKIPGTETYYRIAYEDPENTIYDTFIRSADILSFSYGKDEYEREYVEFKLRGSPGSNGNIRIYTATAGDVTGPNSSTPDAVVLFNGTTGKVLKDSQRTISDTINPLDNNSYTDKRITSVEAVSKLVGLVSQPLRRALEGSADYFLNDNNNNNNNE